MNFSDGYRLYGLYHAIWCVRTCGCMHVSMCERQIAPPPPHTHSSGFLHARLTRNHLGSKMANVHFLRVSPAAKLGLYLHGQCFLSITRSSSRPESYFFTPGTATKLPPAPFRIFLIPPSLYLHFGHAAPPGPH